MDSIICLNGQLMRRDSIQNGANARFLVDSTFKFAERINAMQLTDAEVALFCAVVLVAPDRHGIRNYELINRMHSKLKQCLQHIIAKGRPNEPEFMGNLMNTIGDLKTLSTLHTEKLIVFRNELSQQLNHEQQQQQQVQVTDVTVSFDLRLEIRPRFWLSFLYDFSIHLISHLLYKINPPPPALWCHVLVWWNLNHLTQACQQSQARSHLRRPVIVPPNSHQFYSLSFRDVRWAIKDKSLCNLSRFIEIQTLVLRMKQAKPLWHIQIFQLVPQSQLWRGRSRQWTVNSTVQQTQALKVDLMDPSVRSALALLARHLEAR